MYVTKNEPTVQFYNGDKLITVDGNLLTAEWSPQISDKADITPVLFDAWYDAVEDKLTLISEDRSAMSTIYHPVFTGEPQDKFKCRMELISQNNT